MKKFISFLVVLFLSDTVLANTYVHGYTKKNGTYVQPHYRSDPNNTTRDNWSTKGNVNPYTGKPGTINPQDNNQPSNLNNDLNNSWKNN